MGEMDTCICMAESLCCAPETIPTVLIDSFVVQSLSSVRLFVTPWATARQASLSFTNSQSLLKLVNRLYPNIKLKGRKKKKEPSL